MLPASLDDVRISGSEPRSAVVEFMLGGKDEECDDVKEDSGHARVWSLGLPLMLPWWCDWWDDEDDACCL